MTNVKNNFLVVFTAQVASILGVTIKLCVIFALIAIGMCGLEVFVVVREARVALLDAVPQVKAQVAQIAEKAQGVLGSADASLRTLNKTLRTTNDAINQARDIERDNRAEIKQINSQTVSSLVNFNALLQSLDATQKDAGKSITDASAALVPVIKQTQQDVADLDPVIREMLPLMKQSTAIARNLNASTADVQHEIHKLVYPPPRKWWQKWITDPIHIGAEYFKVTHSVGN